MMKEIGIYRNGIMGNRTNWPMEQFIIWMVGT